MTAVDAKAQGDPPVTLRSKRYIFVCPGCEGLAESDRRDTMTCSPACRVRAHRNGAGKRRKAIARSQKIPAAMIGHAGAIQILRPDLEQLIIQGELTIDDAMPMAVAAFDERMRQILELQP